MARIPPRLCILSIFAFSAFFIQTVEVRLHISPHKSQENKYIPKLESRRVQNWRNAMNLEGTLRIKGGNDGENNADHMGWGTVDMNAADDQLELGRQGTDGNWPEQVYPNLQ